MRNFSVYVVALSLGGCSTFDLYDVYAPQETAKGHVGFDAEDVSVSLQFVPDRQLGTVGVFGVPAIPVFARTSPESALILEVELILERYVDFSFSIPCLQAAIERMCPQHVRVEASVRSVNDDARDANGNRTYGLIESFRLLGPLDISQQRLGEAKRIDAKTIFDYYAYDGQPELDFGVIRLKYAYACPDRCPSEFSLSVQDVAIVDGLLRTEGEFRFKKTRVKDYEALTPVQ